MDFQPFDGPLASRPHTLAEVKAQFGDPTRGGLYEKVPDPTWEHTNVVELHGADAFLPVLGPSYFPIHRLIEPYAREAFRRAEATCPGYVQRPGTWGYNFRHMRHNPRLPLSMHAYGIAIDVNPDDNWSGTFQHTPETWGEIWRNNWPRGVPEDLVKAFESCGFSWGGRWHGFVDPMHFEWVGARDVQV